MLLKPRFVFTHALTTHPLCSVIVYFESQSKANDFKNLAPAQSAAAAKLCKGSIVCGDDVHVCLRRLPTDLTPPIVRVQVAPTSDIDGNRHCFSLKATSAASRLWYLSADEGTLSFPANAHTTVANSR